MYFFFPPEQIILPETHFGLCFVRDLDVSDDDDDDDTIVTILTIAIIITIIHLLPHTPISQGFYYLIYVRGT